MTLIARPPSEKPATDVLVGTVLSWEDPTTGRPGKLLVDVSGATIELSVWEDKVEKLFQKRDPHDLTGCVVEALATFKQEYNGIAQYRPTQIKVMGEPASAPPPAAAPEAQDATPVAPNGYVPTPRDAWSAKGQETGNSKGGGSAIIAAFIMTNRGKLPGKEWLQEAAAAVNTYSAAVMSGKTIEEPEEEEPAEEEDPALMVLSLDKAEE